MKYFFQGLTLLIFSTTVIACSSNTKYKATTAGFEIYKNQTKARKNLKVSLKNKGKQTLKIYAVDAGVLLDYIVLNTKESKFPYHLGAETKMN